MLVFHLNIYATDTSTFRNFNTTVSYYNDIPSSLRNSAVSHILKNTLMEIADIVVVRLITLAKNFILDNFIPAVLIDCLIKNQLNRIDNVTIKSFQVVRS